MIHQNLQEAIEQFSTNEGMNSEEIKNKFYLSKEDMMAMQSDNSLKMSVTRPAPILCSCCMQSDN
jgi:hypothetical protein